MKWSELPHQYQDLSKEFSDECNFNPDEDIIINKFRLRLTPQGDVFWRKCHICQNVNYLPEIIIFTYHQN